MLLLNDYGDLSLLLKNLSFKTSRLQMNRQIEFITFPYSRAKFSIFSITKKNVECFKCRIISNKKYDSRNMSLSNKLPSRTSYLPTDPTSILSFLVNLTKKAEKIRTMRHAMRRCDAATDLQKNCFSGSTNLYKHWKPLFQLLGMRRSPLQ